MGKKARAQLANEYELEPEKDAIDAETQNQRSGLPVSLA